MPLTRRALLRLLALAGAAAALPGCVWNDARRRVAALLTASPIDRAIVQADTGVFSGDNPDRSHGILWDIPGYLRRKGIASFATALPDETTDLVIVGGGMSGLGTAWLLRDRAPLVLERADRFGGNARGESWQGIDYAIGAAYFLEPDAGSPLETLYRDWGLADLYRIKTEEDPVLIEGRIFTDFWTGESAPEARAQFVALKEYFLDVLEERNGAVYPEMPTDDEAMLTRLVALDEVSFRRHLEDRIGAPLHPHLVAVIDHYCWSSLGGTWEEVSAAAGLNFFSAEFGKVYVTPGGNAAVAERIVERLTPALPAGHLRAGAVVFHVEVRADGVLVAYEDAAGQVRTVLAKAVALCCPKFVVKRILHDIEPARLAAIAQLRYRSYLLANVLLEQEVPMAFYDLFLTHADATRATDVVQATYAMPQPGRSVLTLYRGLPFDGARPKILSADAYAGVKAEFDHQIRTEILPALGVDATKVAGVRLTRWGHPLPLAAQGLLRAGLPAQLRAPFRDRVFFVEQDNWALPAIETALGEAVTWAPKIRERLTLA